MARPKATKPIPPIKAQKLIYSLLQSRATLRRLLTAGKKPYAPLVEKLLPLVGAKEKPTSKGLQEILGIRPRVLRDWLEQCYADLIQLLATDADALQIDEVIHCLYFHGERKMTEVRCRLPVTPRLHEGVDMTMIGAEVGGYNYYVEGVHYELEADKLLVHVSLHSGHYNSYIEQLKERAYFEGKLTSQDMQELSDYEIRTRLKKLYSK